MQTPEKKERRRIANLLKWAHKVGADRIDHVPGDPNESIRMAAMGITPKSVNDVLREHATPTRIAENCVTMLCYFSPCGTCGKLMVPKPREDWSRVQVWPSWGEVSLDEQMRRGDLVYASRARSNNAIICEPCSQAGRSTFICHLCKTERPSSALQDSFGDPPDHLCKPCYETVPAAKWNAEVEDLQEQHRWDFE